MTATFLYSSKYCKSICMKKNNTALKLGLVILC